MLVKVKRFSEKLTDFIGKKHLFHAKIGITLFLAFFISNFFSRNLFLASSPKINPSFIADTIQNVSSLIARVTTEETTNLSYATKTGAIILPWYYCPPDGRTCIPDRWKYKPPGSETPYTGASYYRPDDLNYWKIQASDMTCSGVDIALIYTWEKDQQYFDNLKKFSDKIQELGTSPLKIAEYWDASFASNDGGPVDLSQTATAQYRYEKFIKPFYQIIPQNLWATEQGRPLITVYRYGTDSYTNVGSANVFFQTIKNLFKQDFGVEPFLNLGSEWFKTNASEAADAQHEVFNASVACDGNARTHTVKGYTTSSVSPGGWDYRDFGCHLPRDDDGALQKGLSQVPGDANLVIIESWNELGEGSGMERAVNYPAHSGDLLPETFYLESLRTFLGKTDRIACKSIPEVLGISGAPISTPNPNQPTVPPGQPTTPPGQPTNTPVPGQPTTPPGQPTFPPSNQSGTVTIVLHKDALDGPVWNEQTKAGIYIEGPAQGGRTRFGELLYALGSAGTNCKSRGGFPYECPSAGTVVWKGADGKSGTSPGSYKAILFPPQEWNAILEMNGGTLSSGGSLTLDLVISDKNLPTIPPPTQGPNPTPTGGGGNLSCSNTSNQTYGTRGHNPPDPNPHQNKDTVLSLRGFTPSNGELKLITYGYPQGEPPDPKAPQLSTVLGNGAVFSQMYRVLPDQKDDTLAGLTSSNNQSVKAPTNGYDIGGGYQYLVIYASPNELTINVTGDDSAIEGYALHFIDFCTDPNLVSLYNKLHGEGRRLLPALKSGQVIGTAKSTEVKVAIRDSGTFMDPRSRLDWWKGY